MKQKYDKIKKNIILISNEYYISDIKITHIFT